MVEYHSGSTVDDQPLHRSGPRPPSVLDHRLDHHEPVNLTQLLSEKLVRHAVYETKRTGPSPH